MREIVDGERERVVNGMDDGEDGSSRAADGAARRRERGDERGYDAHLEELHHPEVCRNDVLSSVA